MSYHIVFRGTVVGPLTEDHIFAYDVNENTQVSKDNGPWQPLFTYPELMARLSQRRSMGGYSNGSGSDSDSKKILCGIMAIILGGFGVHYFILGKIGAGFVTIALTFVTCGLWAVLMLIQGIYMLTLSDREFDRKYVENPSFMPLF